MNRGSFERAYEARWDELEAQLGDLEGRRRELSLGAFPGLYRQVCQHLSLVRARGYGTDLEQRLNDLVLRGQQHLYRGRSSGWSGVLRMVTTTFPRRVRAEARLFWLSALLLVLPALAMNFAVTWQPDLIYSVMSREQVVNFETMYGDSASALEERPSESNFLMFGYYISHNIGIAFRVFAGGVVAGVGTVFFLLFNGVFLGSAAGYLQTLGLQHTFYPFVIGHGSFELTAIVLAGVAGLRLGLAILVPGGKSRGAALRDAAHAMLPVIYGATFFLVLAAFLEAYWSPRPTAPALRYGVGVALWGLVAAYLLFAGRQGSRSR